MVLFWNVTQITPPGCISFACIKSISDTSPAGGVVCAGRTPGGAAGGTACGTAGGAAAAGAGTNCEVVASAGAGDMAEAGFGALCSFAVSTLGRKPGRVFFLAG